MAMLSGWDAVAQDGRKEDTDDNADPDGDGLTNREERDIFRSDPHRHSFYRGEPFILMAGTNPPNPTSLVNIDIWAVVVSPYGPDEKRMVPEFVMELHYRTLTENLRTVQMKVGPPDTGRVPWPTLERRVADYRAPIPEIYGHGYTEDPTTVAYRLNFIFPLGQFSTGEEISYYITLWNTTRDPNERAYYPHREEWEGNVFEKVKVEAAIVIVDGITDETVEALIFALIFGSLASFRMKKRLTKMSYTDIKWWDAVNRKAYVEVIRIFRDVGEVKMVLRRVSGRMIRLLYFTGITGLLMLAYELIRNPEEISSISLGIIGFFLIFTVISPVLYVYLTRWKHKNPFIGKLRILFLIIFPILIGLAFGRGERVPGYMLIFMFFYFIPMLLYGNLMGTNWNFLIFNFFREFRSGFDHLNNARSGVPKRIFAFFFFWAILIMPIFSVNSLVALTNGTYAEGGFLGAVAEQMIANLGHDYYEQLFTSFIAAFIILNVVLLGVAMVFRVVQLQFYASQKFSGRLGFGLKLHFRVKDSAEDQRSLIGFAFFVFFGYSVLLLLLTVYAQISDHLPTVPGLSADIMRDFLYFQSIVANIIFTFFWFISLPRLPRMFGIRRREDGLVIPS